MKEKIEQLRADFKGQLEQALTLADLEALRVNFLGKKGHIAELMKGLRDVADKKSAGQLINTLKGEVESGILEAEEKMREANVPDWYIPSCKKHILVSTK